MKWEKLCVAANEIEAGMIAGLLENEGIPVDLTYSGINNYLKIFMGPVVAVEIRVPAGKVRGAREIVAAFTGREED
ncbi:putative signal transducing protein [Desulfotomaculum copahuensis]|uniref:DUF2007 domain-containing protein n=1 Tax=Desulfotomaculum copahuensis TaxID=1838280 RepID=A0A1B7LGM0_9FIRM|nr:DUF2007 domain-containing protein [Desulfotomaculum copahuensis]OAT85210.1 hypothetical protein A6M21_06590 [Desulfotomaculum copahuensis]